MFIPNCKKSSLSFLVQCSSTKWSVLAVNLQFLIFKAWYRHWECNTDLLYSCAQTDDDHAAPRSQRNYSHFILDDRISWPFNIVLRMFLCSRGSSSTPFVAYLINSQDGDETVEHGGILYRWEEKEKSQRLQLCWRFWGELFLAITGHRQRQ